MIDENTKELCPRCQRNNLKFYLLPESSLRPHWGQRPFDPAVRFENVENGNQIIVGYCKTCQFTDFSAPIPSKEKQDRLKATMDRLIQVMKPRIEDDGY